MKFDLKRMDLEYRSAARKRIQDNAEFYANNLGGMTDEGNITETTIDAGALEAGCDYFDIKEKEYKFIRFSDIYFGKSDAANDDDFQKVSGVCFYYCNFALCGFNNVRFEACTFVGCNFTECFMLGLSSIFENCSFISRVPGKKSLDDAPSLFNGCELTFRFINCDFTGVVFTKTNFYFCDFDCVNLFDAILVDCSFDITKMHDCDLRNTKFLNPRVIEFNVQDKLKRTLVNQYTFFGRVNYSKREPREVRFANEAYGTFCELFETNKVMGLFGEYFYLAKKSEHDMLGTGGKIASYFGLITCGYGERPVFSLFTSIFIIIACGTLYMLFGVVGSNGLLVYRPGALVPSYDNIVVWYHFSLVTFTSTGYGNVTPVGGSIYVSAVEMVSGVVMIGIWVSTLVRKMAR